MALSTFGFGCSYLVLAWLLAQKNSAAFRDLARAFAAIGLAFLTAAVFLALDAHWAVAVWALEGAALVWFGAWYRKPLASAAGIILQFAAGMVYLDSQHSAPVPLPLLNRYFLDSITLSLSGLFSSWAISRDQESQGQPNWQFAARGLGFWGLAWWIYAGVRQIFQFLPDHAEPSALLLFFTVSSFMADTLSRKLRWPFLDIPALGLLLGMIAAAFTGELRELRPFEGYGLPAWLLALAVYHQILRHHDDLNLSIMNRLHSWTIWLLALLAGRELSLVAAHWIAYPTTWRIAALGFAPAIVLFAVLVAAKNVSWIRRGHRQTYLMTGAGPIALFSWLWIFGVNLSHSGDPYPLSVYIPLLNPLDGAIVFVFVALVFWLREMSAMADDAPDLWPSAFPSPSHPGIQGAFAASLFIWVNGILIRTIHHWEGIPFSEGALAKSMTVQASLSVLWSLCALGMMLFSTSRGQRYPWLFGAGLLALVVLKLFIIDLAGIGTIERIVSFIAVGLLLLLLGYLSPFPPSEAKKG
jgi:uncharacterized membrane protein